MKKLLGVVLGMFLLVGCSSGGVDELQAKDFVYANDKGEVKLNEVFDPESMGEYTYSESESCGYDGLDKVYTYADCEIYTYPKDGKDYVLYVDLFDSAQTARGIHLNDSLEDVKEKYGENYKEDGDYLVYSQDKQMIKFLIIDGKVTFIEYSFEE